MLEDAWGCSEILWPQAAPERPPRRDEKMWTEAEGNRNPIQQGSWGVAIPQDWNWKKAIRWQLSATMRWRGRRLDAVSRRWPTVPSALPVAAAPVSPSIAIPSLPISPSLSLSLSVCVCVCVCMCVYVFRFRFRLNIHRPSSGAGIECHESILLEEGTQEEKS